MPKTEATNWWQVCKCTATTRLENILFMVQTTEAINWRLHCMNILGWYNLSAECLVLSAACWVLSAECWILSAECWVLKAECSVLGAECWVLSAGNKSYCCKELPIALSQVVCQKQTPQIDGRFLSVMHILGQDIHCSWSRKWKPYIEGYTVWL